MLILGFTKLGTLSNNSDRYIISWGHVSLSYPLRTCFFKLSVGDMFLYVISWGHVSLSYQLGTCFFMLSVGDIFHYVISWGNILGGLVQLDY